MNWDLIKFNLEEKYRVKIPDNESEVYKKMMNKGMAPSAILVIFGVFILLFIVVGLLINELPMNENTYVPLGIIFVLLIMEANNMQKKTQENEKKFINYIQNKYTTPSSTPSTGPSSTPSTAPSSRPSATPSTPPQGIKRPIPLVECPICKELIPMGANPCPKCGTHLQWE